MNRDRYPVAVMCKFFGISRSGYYDYVKRLDKPARDADLADMIRKQQEKCDRTYGYRRMWKWLKQTKKIYINPKTILRIMKKYELLAEIRRRRKWRQMGQQLHKYENLLNREFQADRPNHKWVTDISYIHTGQGILYLSVIRDLFDNSIVAYKTGTTQTVNLVLDTIRFAMQKEKKVAAELQLCSDLLFLLHSKTDGIQYKIDRLGRPCFVCNNTIIKQITDNRQIQNTLTSLNIRNICDPFMIWSSCMKISVQ